MSTALGQAAKEYASLGWLVVPLEERGKRPKIAAWQREASSDLDQIADWWDQWPEANVGVRLGRGSGIVDFECDSPEAERQMAELFGGEFPTTPTYRSSRGKHRIFAWTDELPHGGRAVIKYGAVEIRCGAGDKGAQSVFPPSTHPSGGRYEWLIAPELCDLAQIPDSVLTKLANHEPLGGASEHQARSTEEWAKINAGVGEGERNSAAASKAGVMLRNCINPFDGGVVEQVWQDFCIWNDRNRPPLEESELRRVWLSVLKAETRRRTNEGTDRGITTVHVRDGRDGPEEPKGDDWRIVVVNSRPTTYEVYSPHWPGVVKVTSDVLVSGRKMLIAVQEQARVAMLPTFVKEWAGKGKEGGIYHRLMASPEYKEAALEDRQGDWLASMILEKLEEARPLKDGHGLPRDGAPVILDDGTYVVRFGWLYERIKFETDWKLKRAELVEAVALLHGVDYRPSGGAKSGSKGRPRLKQFHPEAIETAARGLFGDWLESSAVQFRAS